MLELLGVDDGELPEFGDVDEFGVVGEVGAVGDLGVVGDVDEGGELGLPEFGLLGCVEELFDDEEELFPLDVDGVRGPMVMRGPRCPPVVDEFGELVDDDCPLVDGAEEVGDCPGVVGADGVAELLDGGEPEVDWPPPVDWLPLVDRPPAVDWPPPPEEEAPPALAPPPLPPEPPPDCAIAAPAVAKPKATVMAIRPVLCMRMLL